MRTYQAAVELFAMLCGRFGLDPMGEDVILSHAEGHKRGIASNHGDPEHLWRGLGMAYTMDGFRRDVKKAMAGLDSDVVAGGDGSSGAAAGLQAKDLKSLAETDVIVKVGALFTADQKKSGILASVSLAQFILESGYGKSELAINANNVFGMKENLSGNTWGDSVWDGRSVYAKKTSEWNGEKYVTVTADFRKYPDVETSIADHSAYLLGAVNGKKKRYEGLKGCTDYRKAAEIIKDGGYATSPDYVEKLCSIVEKWGLTKWDAPSMPAEDKKGMTNADCPFLVKVSIPDLNIRKGAGTNTGKTGRYTGVGVFTVVEVRQGKGSEKGWGRLKSGAGWIALSYCERV